MRRNRSSRGVVEPVKFFDRRSVLLLITAAAAGLVLQGCTFGPAEQSTIIPGSLVRVEVGQSLFSLNDRTSYGDSPANTQILQATSSSFFRYGADSLLEPDQSFGTATVLSNDPLTVRYTLSADAKWSDGVPVDAADLLLAWAANSGALNTKDFDDSDYVDPETGQYSKPFPDSIVYFDGATSEGLQFVTRTPEISDDFKSLTLVWDQYFVDWPLTLEVGLPAHVVSRLAFGSAPGDQDSPSQDEKSKSDDEAVAAKEKLVAAIQDRQQAELSAIANVWNYAFNLGQEPIDPSILISNGPYVISSFEANEAVELRANSSYTGSRKPRFETVRIQFEPDPLLQVQALQSGQADVITPRLDAEVASLLKSGTGFGVIESDTGSYEHLDLRITGSRSGSMSDPTIRRAFLLTIPRAEIQQELVVTTLNKLELRSSMVFFPGQPGYSDALEANGSRDFLTPDIEQAKALLASIGQPNPTVCILYDPANPRRKEEFRLIAAGAALAGFSVADCSSTDWFSLVDAPGSSDASIFSWQVRNTSFAGLQSIYVTGGISNFNGYSDPDVDGLLAKLSVTDDEKSKLELEVQLDKKLFGDAYGLPLYQFRQVVGFSQEVTGIQPALLAAGILWNLEEWAPRQETASPGPVK